jgi:hypothetical protein
VIHVRASGPVGTEILLLKDGVEAARASAPVLDHTAPPVPGVYRVEVQVPTAPGRPPVPWIVSNPIYVGRPATGPAAGMPVAVPSGGGESMQYADGPLGAWRIESNERSRGAIDVVSGRGGGEQVLFRFALGGTRSESPFVAMVMPAGADLANYRRLTFVARASRPMRASVQLRIGGRGSGVAEQRWQKSVFVGTDAATISVPFSSMTRRAGGAEQLDLAGVDSVLFVVDTVNTALGQSGQLWIDDVRYTR